MDGRRGITDVEGEKNTLLAGSILGIFRMPSMKAAFTTFTTIVRSRLRGLRWTKYHCENKCG